MFRNRRNSQKPNDELLAAFKQNFPGIGPSTGVPVAVDAGTAPPAQPGHVVAAGTHIQDTSDHHEPHDISKDAGDLTPSRYAMDQWRLTPLFDSAAFPMTGGVGNPQLGYYTPTPGGINTVYHNQAAGDLHTPGLAFQLGTPLSMPIPDNPLHAGPALDPQPFNPQMFQHHAFDPNNLFAQQPLHHQPAYPPSMLLHKDSGFGASDNSPVPGEDQAQAEHEATKLSHAEQLTPTADPAPSRFSLEQFRYHVTLNAPTAMIRHDDEVPITYLNKGQAYTMSIVDSMPTAPAPGTVRYRTTIRISFEDDQQRQKPSSCWQLWKEGRGLAESHQRGGKLQAVEFVDPHPGAEDDPRRPKIELEHASFDSFVVTWSPPVAASHTECAIAVRFNFLSTDFSHSKGVKGIPVRLCAKTHMIAVTDKDASDPLDAEVSYCKVKLFRDHGAERKLSNDVAHVKKTIEKLKQQIQQAESGIKEPGRKKRTSMSLGKPMGERPTKVAKHKRTWSVSSGGSGGKVSVEEDLHEKLAAVQEMFTSTRSVSVLYLKGEDGDDPDKFPVTLASEEPELLRTGSWDRRPSDERSESGSTVPSPVTTTRPLPRSSSDRPQSTSSLGTPVVKIQKGDNSLEAMDVVPEYVPPEPIERAVACIYAKRNDPGSRDSGSYHRAVYLWHRSADELRNRICSKFSVDPEMVERVLRVTSSQLEVEVDDDVVHHLPEGQDILIDFQDAPTVKSEDEPLLLQDPGPGGAHALVLRLYY